MSGQYYPTIQGAETPFRMVGPPPTLVDAIPHTTVLLLAISWELPVLGTFVRKGLPPAQGLTPLVAEIVNTHTQVTEAAKLERYPMAPYSGIRLTQTARQLTAYSTGRAGSSSMEKLLPLSKGNREGNTLFYFCPAALTKRTGSVKHTGLGVTVGV